MAVLRCPYCDEQIMNGDHFCSRGEQLSCSDIL